MGSPQLGRYPSSGPLTSSRVTRRNVRDVSEHCADSPYRPPRPAPAVGTPCGPSCCPGPARTRCSSGLFSPRRCRGRRRAATVAPRPGGRRRRRATGPRWTPQAGPGPVLVGGISLGAHVAARGRPNSPPVPGGGAAARVAGLDGPTARRPGSADRPGHRGIRPRRRGGGRGGCGRGGAAVARGGAGQGMAAVRRRARGRARCGGRGARPRRGGVGSLAVPAGIAALVDDPVHPLAVAQEWHAALPRSALVTTTLAAFGADPGALGRAAALAWLRAARSQGR